MPEHGPYTKGWPKTLPVSKNRTLLTGKPPTEEVVLLSDAERQREALRLAREGLSTAKSVLRGMGQESPFLDWYLDKTDPEHSE